MLGFGCEGFDFGGAGKGFLRFAQWALLFAASTAVVFPFWYGSPFTVVPLDLRREPVFQAPGAPREATDNSKRYCTLWICIYL